MFKPRWFVIHNTESDDLPDFDADTVADVLENRDLKGYHWLLDNVQGRFWLMSYARPDRPGEHVARHNSEAVGFAFIGNFNKARPSAAVLQAAAPLVAGLLRLYGLTPDNLIAHRDVPDNDTDCPGVMFTPQLFQDFRTMVAEQFEQSG